MSDRAGRPSTWQVVRAVGRVTFREIIRDKVLYNIIIFAMLLLGLGFLASRLTFVSPERVIVDFGISSINFSCTILSIFVGAGMIAKEFERRTIFVALSRPVNRLQFLIGKFTGLALVVLLNWSLLCLALAAILLLSGQRIGMLADLTLFWALFSVFLQSLVVGSLALLISSFSTLSISAMITIGLYLIGNNISQLQLLARRAEPPLKQLFSALAIVLPNLEHFNLGTRVTYGLPLDWRFCWVAVIYAVIWVTLCLWGAGILVNRRES